MVSPAPTSKTLRSASDSKICRASVQAAKATETALAPISVSVRTRLATEKDFWNNRSSSPDSDWPRCDSAKAFFTWPRICGSPSTRESNPLATRIRWLTASLP